MPRRAISLAWATISRHVAARQRHPARIGQDHRQREQGAGLADAVAGLAGQFQGLLAGGLVLGPVPASVMVAGQQDAGPGGRGHLSRHEFQCPFQIARIVPAQLVAEVGPPVQQLRDPDWFGRGVQLLQRGGGEGGAALGVAGVVGRLDRLLQDLGVVGADPFRRVRHLIPQFEDAGDQVEPLGVRHRLGGLGRRLPGAGQRERHIVRGVPVVGHLDVRPVGWYQAVVGVDGLREPGVQPAVLTRQQVLVRPPRG